MTTLGDLIFALFWGFAMLSSVILLATKLIVDAIKDAADRRMR